MLRLLCFAGLFFLGVLGVRVGVTWAGLSSVPLDSVTALVHQQGEGRGDALGF